SIAPAESKTAMTNTHQPGRPPRTLWRRHLFSVFQRMVLLLQFSAAMQTLAQSRWLFWLDSGTVDLTSRQGAPSPSTAGFARATSAQLSKLRRSIPPPKLRLGTNTPPLA